MSWEEIIKIEYDSFDEMKEMYDDRHRVFNLMNDMSQIVGKLNRPDQNLFSQKFIELLNDLYKEFDKMPSIEMYSE